MIVRFSYVISLSVLVAGYLSDLKGRKQTIAYAGVLFGVGALVMAVCPTGALWLLVIGRFIVGLGIGATLSLISGLNLFLILFSIPF